MKVSFTKSATLTITPENAIENYALKKWKDEYSIEYGGIGEYLKVDCEKEWPDDQEET